ncbi:MAG TPA: DUF4961 domain-containing protein [Puia sp.]|nr:DUF4961 domain-containing protein [Puia sp.]
MKNIQNKLRQLLRSKAWGWTWKITATVLITVIIACNLTIESVNQPTNVTGGSTMTVTLQCQIFVNSHQTSAFVVGMLVPKVWNASANTTMSFTSDITSGPQPMTLVPPGTPDPTGNGLSWQDDLMQTVGHAANLIPEYEWIVFQSNTAYATSDNTTYNVTVTINTTVAQQNVLFNMAYCIAESTDGLHSTAWGKPSTSYYGTFFPGAVRVNGTGTLLDFVNPQLSVIVPGSSLDNDIITIPFNATASSNGLSTANAVYLCATGYTSAGDSIKVCEQTGRTQLQNLGQGQWQLDLWPRGFFGLTPQQTLDSINYFFTDATGATRVGYGGGASPFSYTFSCQ